MYFRNKITELTDFIQKNDISIRFRLKKPNKPSKNISESRKVLGNIIGFKICDRVYNFLNTWKKHIDAIPLYEKPKGYGQTSFYYAYKEHLKDIKWGDLPVFARNNNRRSVLWTANKGTNAGVLKNCMDEFNTILKN